MIKKIVAIALLSTGLISGSVSQSNKAFIYEYSVILNNNSLSDLLEGYVYKEYLIDEYNDLINYLDPSLHQDAIINNIERFAKEGSVSRYVDGKIVVEIGKGEGHALHGELKSNSCDASNVRIKFFFSKFFFNK